MRAIHTALVALATASLAGACATDDVLDDDTLDPALEQFDDGKYDGPVVPVQRGDEYKIEVSAIETTDYGEWTVQPERYLTVADARSINCPSTLDCDFDLADLDGGLQTDGAARLFDGNELRDGVEFAVHERFRMDDGSIVDDIKGLTRIRIGSTGSLRIKPFGKVKSIEFRVRF